VKIINQTKNTVLAEDAVIADTLSLRLKGLLGKNELKRGQALILYPCNSIHTFFMRFPIDVIFVDRKNKVVFLKNNLLPWRLSPILPKAKFVIEFPSGAITETKTTCGDEILLG
jgi:uncharacterized membrane protein (UPF0127 family)